VERGNKLGVQLAGPVSSDAIEGALASDWRELHASADGGETIARASVLTLIVAIQDPARLDPVLDAFEHLSDQHPSRTLILLTNSSIGASDLQVWHTAGCERYLGEERLLCGEQIVIAGRGGGVHLLPSLTDQLTLPDLPSFLWWVGDLSPVDDVLFERLTELADRVIVDSADFLALGPSTARLYRLARRRHQPCAPSDLSWARLTPWRDLVAQFFDAPTLRPHLSSLRSLAIEVDATSPDGLPQALLLIAWLASRLGWEADPAAPELRFARVHDQAWSRQLRDANGHPIAVTVQPVAQASGPNGLRQVTLTAEDNATFVVRREEDGSHARTEADLAGAPVLRRIARFETADLSTLVADELMLFRRDHVYEEALTFATGLTGGVSQWPSRSA
jgi:glucose-6-phosphate dehydrogenase assembly protein OpcA